MIALIQLSRTPPANTAKIVFNSLQYLLIGMVLASGCGKAESTAKTYSVKGKVTFQGKPVTHGSVIFVSNNPDLASAYGRIDQQGGYSLTTYHPDDGAPAGEFIVAIRAYEDLGNVTEFSKIQAKPLVPEKYVSFNTSPLRKTVQEQKLNTIDIEL